MVGDFIQKHINNDIFEWINMENKQFLEAMFEELGKQNGNLENFGAEIYKKGISFSKISILLDEFSKFNNDKEIYIKNRDKLAKGYIFERLPNEIKLLKLAVHNNPAFVTKKDLLIIDELFVWLEKLIGSVLTSSLPPEINGRIDKFIKFVNEKEGSYFDNKDIKNNFLTVNKALYDAAQEVVKLYAKKEYYYFILVYIEMIELFLKMANLLSSMFLESELLSIYIDPVTLLPNRFQLLKDLQTINNACILIINMHNFSKLNVLYGFEFGDVILKKVALYLKTTNALKSYRIYGDEFAILAHNLEEIEEIFNSLNESIQVAVDDETLDIMFYGAYHNFTDKALEKCEFALSKTKKGLIDANALKDKINDYKNEISMRQKLKEAMIKDEIIPYYQPIYLCNPSNKILKYEVLMRVRYNNKLLSPAEFMDALKDAPFYTEFTKSILLKSFEMFKNSELTFSVNFTMSDIKDRNLVTFLKTLVKKYPNTAKRFTIEFVETEAIDEFDKLNEFIQEMKHYGVSFALDDFGSGYSNFAQVAKLHIDFVKIDGSIIQPILEDERMQKLFHSIVAFAKNLHLKTIAEFVSSKELFDYLCNKVDMLQGYYVGKPEPYLIKED